MTMIEEYRRARETLQQLGCSPAHFTHHMDVAPWCLDQADNLLSVAPNRLSLKGGPMEISCTLSHIFKTACVLSLTFQELVEVGEASFLYHVDKDVTGILKECEQMFERKNADYGDSFSQHGAVGVGIRVNDKLRRMSTLIEEAGQVEDETILDTCLDLVNYAIMMYICVEREYAPGDMYFTHVQIDVKYCGKVDAIIPVELLKSGRKELMRWAHHLVNADSVEILPLDTPHEVEVVEVYEKIPEGKPGLKGLKLIY